MRSSSAGGVGRRSEGRSVRRPSGRRCGPGYARSTPPAMGWVKQARVVVKIYEREWLLHREEFRGSGRVISDEATRKMHLQSDSTE